MLEGKRRWSVKAAGWLPGLRALALVVVSAGGGVERPARGDPARSQKSRHHACPESVPKWRGERKIEAEV